MDLATISTHLRNGDHIRRAAWDEGVSIQYAAGDLVMSGPGEFEGNLLLDLICCNDWELASVE